MKDIAKRGLIGFIVFIISMAIFHLTVKVFEKREYKYIDMYENWGVSEKCFEENNKFYCKTEQGILNVLQYYWEDKKMFNRIDTVEAGAGSYPEPPENKEKCYRFKCLCEVEIDCWGKDVEDAKKCCNLTDYSDLNITSIEDIVDWEVTDL